MISQNGSVYRQPIEKYGNSLPHAPTILARLQQRLQWAQPDAKELATLVSSDAALVVKILRIVNSAYYQLPRKLNDLTYAIAYLGYAEIYRIVLAAAVVNQFQSPGESFRQFWRHSFLTALIARHLLPRAEAEVSAGEMWPAALLHDIGRLIMLRLDPEQYATLSEYCNENKCLTSEAEEALGTVTHTELGAMLCERWGLPDTVIDACQHHELERYDAVEAATKTVEIRRIVSAANLIANLTVAPLRKELQQMIRERICVLLRVDEDVFLLEMAKAYELNEEAEAFPV